MNTTLSIRRSLVGALIVGALVITVAACGDDDDDGAAASSAFCGDLESFNAALMTTDISPESTAEEIESTSALLTPLWNDVRANAPATLSAEIAPLTDTVEALAAGDPEPFSADETFEQYNVFLGSSVDACPFEKTSVEAGDYWFKGVPETLTAGTVALQFTNTSDDEDHEFVLFKKNDPAQSAEEILALDESEMEGAITFAGVAWASPGEKGTGLVSVEPGSYLALCFVPIGGADDAAPHFTAGQVAELTVS